MDFGTVLIFVAVLAVVVAAASYWGAGRVYGDIGRGDFEMDHTPAGPPGAGSEAEAREEIRQMLEAKASGSAQRDPGLREEVRQLVIARNERRRRQGKEPLDVEAEIERQLRSLGA